jgi:hypothetical protein
LIGAPCPVSGTHGDSMGGWQDGGAARQASAGGALPGHHPATAAGGGAEGAGSLSSQLNGGASQAPAPPPPEGVATAAGTSLGAGSSAGSRSQAGAGGAQRRLPEVGGGCFLTASFGAAVLTEIYLCVRACGSGHESEEESAGAGLGIWGAARRHGVLLPDSQPDRGLFRSTAARHTSRSRPCRRPPAATCREPTPAGHRPRRTTPLGRRGGGADAASAR